MDRDQVWSLDGETPRITSDFAFLSPERSRPIYYSTPNFSARRAKLS
jgi:hypothetical protein